jgi:uncharacterized protein (TIGR02231 family)
MIDLLLALPLLASPPVQGPADPVVLDTTIAEVAVYTSSASVRRTATVPKGGGRFVVEGLPWTVDPASVRLMSRGAEVASVEVTARLESNVPAGRVKELREQLAQLERELEVVRDDEHVLEDLYAHLRRLLMQEESAHQREVEVGRPSPEAWQANFDYLAGRLKAVRRELREAGWARVEAERRVAAARQELGDFSGRTGVNVRDVLFDLVDTSGGPASVVIEYVAERAGWAPAYDLRAAKDLSSVDLVYRARVWQHTGEDWNDVDVMLSTAQPQRGAQGPEPAPVWVSLFDPRSYGRGLVAYDAAPAAELKSLGYSGNEESELLDDGDAESWGQPAATFASVQSHGLTVRFKLARRETILSRDEPSTVLVGRQALDIRPEHYCVPALDTTVWLRAIAKNESAWTMLPGRAAVYFGGDFIGNADMDAVQVGQEFTMHLGPDPGLVVERKQLEDQVEESGMFSSKATLHSRHRIKLENHGAFSQRADGAVQVFVQEVLPRSTDDRVEVEVAESRPARSRDTRWAEVFEEDGVMTWVIELAPQAERQIDLTVEITYPEDMQLQYE